MGPEAGVAVGTPVWRGFEDLNVFGDTPITLVSAELIEVDPGLELVRFWVFDELQSGEGFYGWVGDLRADFPRITLQPLEGTTIDPSEPTRWTIVAEMVPKRSGTLEFEGLRVRYEVDGEERDQSYPHRMVIEVPAQ